METIVVSEFYQRQKVHPKHPNDPVRMSSIDPQATESFSPIGHQSGMIS